MADLENMDVKLGNREYHPIEKETDQMTGFSNMLDREDNGDIGSVRGNSSHECENRNMPENGKIEIFQETWQHWQEKWT